MRGVLRPEIVALDGTGEAFTDRGANDVDFLAFLEEIDLDLLASFELPLFGLVVSPETELGDKVAGFNPSPWRSGRLQVWTRGTLYGRRQ